MPFKIDTIETDNLSVNGTQITENGGLPYKVYTALLTQSGGDNPLSIDTGLLTIGVTYMIATSFTGDDFSNVGGPKITFDDEGIGTYFIATGTTPANWTNETEFEYNTGAPVVTVLENTIGNIWFNYVYDGYYQVSSDPEILFPIGKTVSFIGSAGDDSATRSYGFLRFGGSYLYILTQDSDQTDANGVLNNTSIEIRVYN